MREPHGARPRVRSERGVRDWAAPRPTRCWRATGSGGSWPDCQRATKCSRRENRRASAARMRTCNAATTPAWAARSAASARMAAVMAAT